MLIVTSFTMNFDLFSEGLIIPFEYDPCEAFDLNLPKLRAYPILIGTPFLSDTKEENSWVLMFCYVSSYI